MKVKVAVMGMDGQTVLGEYAVEADTASPKDREDGQAGDGIFERARRAAVEDGAVSEADSHLLSYRVVSE